MATVYVFGAGASKHAGYPLASEMGAEIISWMQKRDYFRFTSAFIAENFGSSPNIEDIVTAIDAECARLENAEDFADRAKRSELSAQRGKIREAIPVWFREIHLNPAPAYAAFANAMVRPGDTIITFNYDDSLERELRRAGRWEFADGYGFPMGTSGHVTDVPVLKLHGSMNWLVAIFGGMRGFFAAPSNRSLGNGPLICKNDLQYLGYDLDGSFPNGSAGFPSLILPGRTKEFYYYTSFGPEHEEFFDSLWMLAGHALANCDQIVISGYSLPSADERARQLLLDKPARSHQDRRGLRKSKQPDCARVQKCRIYKREC